MQKLFFLVFFICSFTSFSSLFAQEDIYSRGCVSCHGEDGKGRPINEVGFDIPLPDFSDCEFTSREPDADWLAIVHEGGPVRSFDRTMPSFGLALSENQILNAIQTIRTFCADQSWPRGEFNLPKGFFVEKAFPEDELVVTQTFKENSSFLETEIIYENRIGSRGMWEVKIPLVSDSFEGSRDYGIGDIALAYKHTLVDNLDQGLIVSSGVELITTTGNSSLGFGGKSYVLEPFLAAGLILPDDYFLQLHSLLESPLDDQLNRELGLRLGFGRTFMQQGYGRSVSPMIEMLAKREIASGESFSYDLVPQVQISLSTRQHVLFNVGLRIPVSGEQRDLEFLSYILWDWFDGPFSDGW